MALAGRTDGVAPRRRPSPGREHPDYRHPQQSSFRGDSGGRNRLAGLDGETIRGRTPLDGRRERRGTEREIARLRVENARFGDRFPRNSITASGGCFPRGSACTRSSCSSVRASHWSVGPRANSTGPTGFASRVRSDYRSETRLVGLSRGPTPGRVRRVLRDTRCRPRSALFRVPPPRPPDARCSWCRRLGRLPSPCAEATPAKSGPS